MGIRIDILEKDLKILLALLQQFLPNTLVWAFGSRVKFTAKPTSDLDLVAFISEAQKWNFSLLKEALAESDLPFRVDLHDWNEIPENFKKNIKNSNLVIQKLSSNKKQSSWKKYKLSDLLEIKYGKDHKHLADGDIPLYGSGGIIRYVDTPIYKEESILIPRKGTLNNLFYLNKPFWSVDTVFYTKIKKGNNGKYLFYLLKSMNLASLNVGSAVPSLTTEVLNMVEINVPDDVTQQQIAQILTSLDDKIELNLQMNQTLEAMAQTIFKEWCCVDEGVIPNGWSWKKLHDVADISSSKRIFMEDYTTKGVPFYRGKEITQLSNELSISTELFISDEKYKNIKEKFGVPQIGDILITSVGTIGSVWLVDNNMPFYFKDGNVTWVKNYKTNVNGEFVYQWFQTRGTKEQINSVTIGSTQQALTISALKGLNILIPDKNTVSLVCDQLKAINSKRINNLFQTRVITQIRDSLLPRLMSGNIIVNG